MSKTRLLDAVQRLDLEAARAVLQKHTELIDVTDRGGRNLLHLACRANCAKLGLPLARAVRVVEFLLNEGLDVESLFGSYVNSTFSAVTLGHNPEVVKLLVKRGATPRGLFAAGWSEDLPMLKLLLRLGAEVDEHVEDETPFLHCSKNARFKAARILLQAGAAIDFQDSRGKTALYYSVEREHDPSWLRFLVKKGASADLADRDGATVRLKASRKRDKRFLKALD